MLKLDNNLLDELGLGSLPEAQKRQMLQHIYETLELRVGTQLANQMTDKQLEDFERFIDAGGDANQQQALQWLEANLPNYKQVVQETFDALKTEVRGMAPQLLASAQQAQTAAPQQGYAPQPQSPIGSGNGIPPQSYQQAPTPQQYQPQQPAQPYGIPQQPAYPVQPSPQQHAAPAPQPQYGTPQQPVASSTPTPQPAYAGGGMSAGQPAVPAAPTAQPWAPQPQPPTPQSQSGPQDNPAASTGVSDNNLATTFTDGSSAQSQYAGQNQTQTYAQPDQVTPSVPAQPQTPQYGQPTQSMGQQPLQPSNPAAPDWGQQQPPLPPAGTPQR